MVNIYTPDRPLLLRALNNDLRVVKAFEGLFAAVASEGDQPIADGEAGGAIFDLVSEVSKQMPLEMPAENSEYIQLSTPQVGIADSRLQVATQGLEFGANGIGITLGRDAAIYVDNTSGADIGKGDGVMLSGGDGEAEKAVADGTIDAVGMLGVAAQDISDGSSGFVIATGRISGINTSSYSSGDYLYFDASTAGALTSTRPAPPNLRSPIATVLTSNATSGAILVHMRAERKLSDAQDVDETGLADGDLLSWDAAASKWGKLTPAAGATGSFTALSGETITVTNGLITAIV